MSLAAMALLGEWAANINPIAQSHEASPVFAFYNSLLQRFDLELSIILIWNLLLGVGRLLGCSVRQGRKSLRVLVS